MQKFGIGQPVARFEDPRLLRGEGRYLGDIDLPGQAYAVVLRSLHAHARIKGLDTAAARAAPGVLAVYTGADYAADGLGGPRATMPRKRPDGTPMFAPERPALCIDRVRYVGDPIAFIVAGSLNEAKDAAELVAVHYEPLPSVTDTAKAALPGSPSVWDECPDNISHVHSLGDKVATDAAFARADHALQRRYVVTRVHAQFMEPRGALGLYDPAEMRYTLYADCQYPHRVRNMLAESVFKIPESRMRVIANDVGGGFGTKGWQYVEHRLVLWAARKLGRPVKWTCERSEAILADEHGRDNVSDVEIALAKDGRILGFRVAMTCNIGAYIGSNRNILSPFLNMGTSLGVYAIPAAHVMMTGILSNCSPTAPYRGAGRPEAIYVIERILDDAAREFGFDRIELRRLNTIPASSLPYKNALGSTYDCGDFAAGSGARRHRRLRSASPRLAQTGQAARHRPRQRHREGRRPRPGVRRGPLQSERNCRGAHGHQEPGPRPRDDIQANPARAARPRPRRGAVHRRGHRPCRLRHGHQRLTLDGDRRQRAHACRGQGDREGQADRGPPAGGGGQRCGLCQWRLFGEGHQ
jgi:carbon-monoxide dehydrogenase large subunit